MRTFRRLTPLLSAGALLLAACADESRAPTDPGLDPSASAAAAARTQAIERPHEERLHRIAQEVKGFGGYHFAEDGTLVALLQDPGAEAAARRALEPVLKEHAPSARQRGAGAIRFEKAQYAFLDLAAWRDRASDPVLGVTEVHYTDLDEARNRFVVGVGSGRAREEVAKVLREHGVPMEAVVFEEARPVEELLSLRDRSRPIAGGFQIQRSGGGTCTLGFNASWKGYHAFLTNSHCTSSFWKTDGTLVYQNDTSPTSNVVGWEASDPGAWSCGFLWLWDCRWSDAAVIRKYADVDWDYGRIARTTSWATGAGNAGSLTVDPKNPRMTIAGEVAFPTGGEMFDKMGRTTGWTYGFVRKTCVDVNKSGMRRAVCQDWIRGMHADFGDSGSPIFRWHGNTVTLAGLLWGRTTEGGTPYILMSAMWNIERDLGALGTS